jgi:uncharacterized protein
MNYIRKIGLSIVGWLFIILGILGLFLPILQGILFIMVGMAILSSRSEIIKRFLNYLKKRHPQHYRHVMIWRERVINWFRKT